VQGAYYTTPFRNQNERPIKVQRSDGIRIAAGRELQDLSGVLLALALMPFVLALAGDTDLAAAEALALTPVQLGAGGRLTLELWLRLFGETESGFLLLRLGPALLSLMAGACLAAVWRRAFRRGASLAQLALAGLGLASGSIADLAGAPEVLCLIVIGGLAVLLLGGAPRLLSLGCALALGLGAGLGASPRDGADRRNLVKHVHQHWGPNEALWILPESERPLLAANARVIGAFELLLSRPAPSRAARATESWPDRLLLIVKKTDSEGLIEETRRRYRNHGRIHDFGSYQLLTAADRIAPQKR